MKVTLGIVSILITVCILKIVDMLFGILRITPIQLSSLPSYQLPPNITAYYQTDEYRFRVTTNSLGFRGSELNNDATIRILTIGDSTTYGWGVNQDDSWPELTKQRLGKKASIVNASLPGDSPDQYLLRAMTLIPQLKPNIVLIGFSEADDVAQIRFTPTPSASDSAEIIESATPHEVRNSLHTLLPHIMAYVTIHNTVDIRSLWKQQARQYLTHISPEQVRRYQQLPRDIKDYYAQGLLNPGLLWTALNDPDHYIHILHPDDIDLIRAYGELREIFMRIHALTRANGTRLFIVDIPHLSYVSGASHPVLTRLGIHTDPLQPTSTVPLDSLHELVDDLGIPIIETLPRMRNDCQTDCFFPLDTHLNTRGHAIIADEVTRTVTELDRLLQ